MCKILLLLNKDVGNATNRLLASNFVKANTESLASQRDGWACYKGGKVTRGMDYENIEEDISYVDGGIYCCHTRIRTCGATDKKGTHLQARKDNYLFCHNGSVQGLVSRSQNSSDSQVFADILLSKKPTMERVSELAGEYNFLGKGVLINRKTDEVRIWVNQIAYFSRLSDTLLAFTSYQPHDTVTVYEYATSLGMLFEVGKIEQKISEFITSKVDDEYFIFRNYELVDSGIFKAKKPKGNMITHFTNYPDYSDNVYQRGKVNYLDMYPKWNNHTHYTDSKTTQDELVRCESGQWSKLQTEINSQLLTIVEGGDKI